MATRISVLVKETKEELKKALSKASAHQRPRLKMLLLLSEGISDTATLSAKTGADRNSIAGWKKRYNNSGIEALLDDARGGDKRSGITPEQKQKIAMKLSDPEEAFRSYGEAQAWLLQEMGISKEYHAFNKYLKRNWGTKLKVGRKSHVKKDEAAVAVFKKPS
jgi:transposase